MRALQVLEDCYKMAQSNAVKLSVDGWQEGSGSDFADLHQVWSLMQFHYFFQKHIVTAACVLELFVETKPW